MSEISRWTTFALACAGFLLIEVEALSAINAPNRRQSLSAAYFLGTYPQAMENYLRMAYIGSARM
jgi:hypothetical protein